MRDKPNDLKPCPFCGYPEAETTFLYTQGYTTRCANCGAFGPRRRSREEAALAWNGRAQWDRPEEE